MAGLLRRLLDRLKPRPVYWCLDEHPHATAAGRDYCGAERGAKELTNLYPWVMSAFQAGDTVILRSREPLDEDERERVRVILAEWQQKTGVHFLHLTSGFEVVGVKVDDALRGLQI